MEFSLLGGPLHRVGRRLGLVRGTNTVVLGLVLGVGAWMVAVVLAVIGGVADRILSWSVIGAHVRLIVVIPLLFVCESLLDPRAAAFVRIIVKSKVVSDSEVPQLQRLLTRIARWNKSWVPDAVCLLLAASMSLNVPILALPGKTAVFDPAHVSPAALWYWSMCLPLFRFLILRWAWRLLLWWYFLYGVARLKLNLVATHPDGVAGLGYLEVVHAEFTALIVAISAATAAALAESIVVGTLPFTAIYSAVALVLVLDAFLFLGPLSIFTPRLWLCRVTALDTYMEFASRYVSAFDKKWLGKGGAQRDDLLGTSDLQSLADLSGSLEVIADMRLVPVTYRLAFIMLVAALVPMLPLLLLQYPITELTAKFFNMVFGL